MQTIEAIRKKIKTTEDLQSIVKTMKSLSAASISQYDRAVTAIAEYHRTIELGLQIVLKDHLPDEPRKQDTTPRIAVILFGSDFGLCGRFNDQVVDFAQNRLQHTSGINSSDRWLVCGVKAAMRLEASGIKADKTFPLPGSVTGLADNVGLILQQLDEWREQNVVDQAIIFHNHREKVGASTPVIKHLWPVDYRYLRALSHLPWESRNLPMTTMKHTELLSTLIRQHLFVITFQAGAHSMAAEHAARLSAMQGAEHNIGEKLQDINSEYRRIRQDAITTELIDIISGYQASK